MRQQYQLTHPLPEIRCLPGMFGNEDPVSEGKVRTSSCQTSIIFAQYRKRTVGARMLERTEKSNDKYNNSKKNNKS